MIKCPACKIENEITRFAAPNIGREYHPMHYSFSLDNAEYLGENLWKCNHCEHVFKIIQKDNRELIVLY